MMKYTLTFLLALIVTTSSQASAAQFASDDACDPRLTSPVAYGCTATSDELSVDYPALGEIQCGAALTISQSSAVPFVRGRTADPAKLYSLLLVDTTVAPPGVPFSPHPVLHFGAVNIPGGDLIGGLSLDDDSSNSFDIFSAYRGPSPPPPSFVPGIENQLFRYEYMLAEQADGGGPVDVPALESNANFDYGAFLADNTSDEVVSTYFGSGYCVAPTIGSPCQTVTTPSDFDLTSYVLGGTWYSHQQRPQPFQPAELLYCVSADYAFLDDTDPRSVAGYDISVYNVAQDVGGNVYTSDDQDQLGPTAAGPLCGAQFAFADEGPAKLTVGQCFLPPTTFGSSNYWVLAYDEEEGMALIGSQPDVPSGDPAEGLCTFSSPFSGLWIFSRSPVRNEAMIQKYRNIAKEKGIDPSIMLDVKQVDCGRDNDDGDNEGGGAGNPEEIPGYVQIQGKSSDSGKKVCWELRNGKVREGNKIILGRCSAGSDKNLFKVSTYTLPGDSKTYLQVTPKLAENRKMVVTGVRENSEKGWLRLEKQLGGGTGGGETQTFYALENGMVGLGTPASDCESSSEGCLFVTNQGAHSDYGDPVMLSSSSRMNKFARQGDVIVEWAIVSR